MKIYILISLLLSLLNTPLFSGHKTYKYIRSKLMNLPPKDQQAFAQDIGSICEFIAKEIIARKYRAASYDIKTNLTYHDGGSQQLGEIDIVVFNRKSHIAELLIEVKCRKNHEEALNAAHEQLKRFKNLVINANDQSARTYIHKDTTYFSTAQFKTAATKVMMPKKCYSCQRQAWEFDLTLSDIKKLQGLLQRAQTKD